jgi:hypothetical protein
MTKTFFQPGFQADPLEKQLKNKQARKGCELLVFETEHRDFMEFCRNLCFTGFHLRWPPGLG